MDSASDKSIFELYPEGSKCSEYINDLSNIGVMTWDAVYWRVKYLYIYGRSICKNEELLNYLNGCFNQGLSVNVNRELYMDARKMQAELYILGENFRMASNCILAVLDITEDIPPEMFLDLTYAEIHTDLLRVLKNPAMFFNDLHSADLDENLHNRQKSILLSLLCKATEEKIKNSSVVIDVANIEKEVIKFGVTNTKEYTSFKKAIAGEAVEIPTPIFQPTKIEKETIQENEGKQSFEVAKEGDSATERNAEGLLEIVIFPEDQLKTDQAIDKKIIKKSEDTPVEPSIEKNTKVKTQDEEVKSNDDVTIKNIENMFAALMMTVTENTSQIASLHDKIKKMADDSETAKIRAELEESELKNKELIEQFMAVNALNIENKKQLEERERMLLESEKKIEENRQQIAESEKRIAEKEQEKRILEDKLVAQEALIEEKKNAEFSEEELKSFEAFDKVIIIDTCAIEHQPELLDYITEQEMVRISQTVIQELENHKKYKYDRDKQMMGQKCLKAIYAAKGKLASCEYEGCYTFLLPESFRIKENDDIGTANDKEIFSLAMRYKIHSKTPVLIISDDTTMQVMAESVSIGNVTSEEFVTSRTKVEVKEKLSKDQFLEKKLKCNEYTLSQHEITTLWSYGIKTIGDLLAKTDEELSFIKDKKGIRFGPRITTVRKKIKAKYDTIIGDK